VRPLRTLFATSRGKKSVATSVLVKVVLGDGTVGLGEAPTSFNMPYETLPVIHATLRQARTRLAGVSIDDYPAWLAKFRRSRPTCHMTLAGLEVALFRASLAVRSEGEWRHWGGRRDRIETDITIPFLTDRRMLEEWLARIAKTGFRTYKVKVSGKIEDDMALVRAVRESLKRGGRPFTIRLDGNQGYTDRSYLAMLDRLGREGIEVELFEQPLPQDDFAGLKRIARRSRLPVILDETVCDEAACRRVADEGLGQGVNIKIAKSGIAGSAAIIKTARRAGLKLMIGCMTETMVGLSAGINLAAGTGAFDYVDLDSVHLLSGRRSCQGITASGPQYLLEEG
jgi:L-alanine-DL-glutamate epimerase-like enolase superfamily enzyme